MHRTSFGDAVILILALCFHSVFEGIAIGVAGLFKTTSEVGFKIPIRVTANSMKLITGLCRDETGRMESLVDNITPQGVCSHSHGSCSPADATQSTSSLLLLIRIGLRYLNSSWRGHRHHHRCDSTRSRRRLGVCGFHGVGFRSVCICSNQPSACKRILFTFQNYFGWTPSESHGCYLGSSHYRSCHDLGCLSVNYLEIIVFDYLPPSCLRNQFSNPDKLLSLKHT